MSTLDFLSDQRDQKTIELLTFCRLSLDILHQQSAHLFDERRTVFVKVLQRHYLALLAGNIPSSRHGEPRFWRWMRIVRSRLSLIDFLHGRIDNRFVLGQTASSIWVKSLSE